MWPPVGRRTMSRSPRRKAGSLRPNDTVGRDHVYTRMTDSPVRAARRMSAWSNAIFSAPVSGSVTRSRQVSPNLFADVSRVFLRGQETITGGGRRGGLDLDHPPVPIRVGVHERRLFVEPRIDREHGAGDRRHEIRD